MVFVCIFLSLSSIPHTVRGSYVWFIRSLHYTLADFFHSHVLHAHRLVRNKIRCRLCIVRCGSEHSKTTRRCNAFEHSWMLQVSSWAWAWALYSILTCERSQWRAVYPVNNCKDRRIHKRWRERNKKKNALKHKKLKWKKFQVKKKRNWAEPK